MCCLIKCIAEESIFCFKLSAHIFTCLMIGRVFQRLGSGFLYFKACSYPMPADCCDHGLSYAVSQPLTKALCCGTGDSAHWPVGIFPEAVLNTRMESNNSILLKLTMTHKNPPEVLRFPRHWQPWQPAVNTMERLTGAGIKRDSEVSKTTWPSKHITWVPLRDVDGVDAQGRFQTSVSFNIQAPHHRPLQKVRKVSIA